jgi:hypothetical protein
MYVLRVCMYVRMYVFIYACRYICLYTPTTTKRLGPEQHHSENPVFRKYWLHKAQYSDKVKQLLSEGISRNLQKPGVH